MKVRLWNHSILLTRDLQLRSIKPREGDGGANPIGLENYVGNDTERPCAKCALAFCGSSSRSFVKSAIANSCACAHKIWLRKMRF